MMQHAFSVALQLNFNLPVDELQKSMLVHLIVEVVGLVGALLEPRPWHFKLGLEIVPWIIPSFQRNEPFDPRGDYRKDFDEVVEAVPFAEEDE